MFSAFRTFGCSVTSQANATFKTFFALVHGKSVYVDGVFHRCLNVTAVARYSDSVTPSSTPAKKHDTETVVAPKLLNRNPRNLELLGIARKRSGWSFQYPSKEYYNRLIFHRSPRSTAAYVEHSSGRKVVSASTRELAIMRHLYSPIDVSAAENIGSIIARRCLESGISCLVFQELDNNEKSEKMQAFRNAVIAGGIELQEAVEFRPDYEPGIDYDDPEALNDLERRQWLVYRLGMKSKTMKALKVQHGLRVRRRPLRRPDPLEIPSYPSTSS